MTFQTLYQASLIGTFGVLIWYTVETYKIRKITAQQKDLQYLPAIMLYMRNRSGSPRLIIRNIGEGSATAVMVLPASFNVSGDKLEWEFHLVDSNDTLVAGEERDVGIGLSVNGKEAEMALANFIAYYNPPHLRQAGKKVSRELIVRFNDITGQTYETTINFSNEGITVVKSPLRNTTK